MNQSLQKILENEIMNRCDPHGNPTKRDIREERPKSVTLHL